MIIQTLFRKSIVRLLALLPALILLMPPASNAQSEPFRQTLTSTEGRIHVDTWQLSPRDLHLDSGNWLIRKDTLRGGKQEGVDVITVDNGKLTLAICPTRGMSILRAQMGDLKLEWGSPVKEVVHPKFINLESRKGLGWLEGFNEWMVRCGLEFAGHPGTDKFVDNTGATAEMDLTLHGKIGNIPASVVEIVVERQPPYRLRVRGRVDERMFYGPKLELWTEVSTEPGSDQFVIEDTITNHGAYDQEFEIIYHANFGRPLLEAGAEFVAPVAKVIPFNDHAAKGVETYSTYNGPKKGFIEEVFCVYPLASPDGQSTIMLRNAAADRAASMTFATNALPFVTLWKNTSAIEEGYVTGLEPGTNFPFNRSVERAQGRLQKLAPKESRTFKILVGLHPSEESVTQTANRISQIQKSHKPEVMNNPLLQPSN